MSTIAHRSTSPFAELMEWLDSGSPLASRGFGLTPYVHVEDYMEEGTYVLRAEMPGIDPEKDVSLDIEDGMLRIRGERHEEEKEKNRHEFHYGSFTRSIPLPADVKPDEVSATYRDGVLEVRVPRVSHEETPVKIPVTRDES